MKKTILITLMAILLSLTVSFAEAKTVDYEVRKGDSLWTIAENKVGDSSAWTNIWKNNSETISNPNMIVPGQIIKIFVPEKGQLDKKPVAPPVIMEQPRPEPVKNFETGSTYPYLLIVCFFVFLAAGLFCIMIGTYEILLEKEAMDKMKTGIALALAMIFILSFSGCATNNSYKISDIGNLQGGDVQRTTNEELKPPREVSMVEKEGNGKTTVHMPTDPYHTLGLLKTQALAAGKVTPIEGVMPDIRFGEYFPGSIGGKCWAVRKSDKKEYFCQSVLSRLATDSLFRLIYVIEADPEEVAKDVYVVGLSIMGDYAYDLSGKEIPLEKKFNTDAKYRYEKIMDPQLNTKASNAPLVEGFVDAARQWNEYNTPQGILLSPLGANELNYIAGINPQYKFVDKLIGTGDFSLVPDPSGIIAGLALDTFRAMGAPSTGWDYLSQLPSRRDMGLIIEYVGRLKQDLFAKMLLENQRLKAELEKMQTSAPVAQAGNLAQKDEVKKVSKKNPNKTKISAEIQRSAEKIAQLGYDNDTSLYLADKFEKKECGKAQFASGTKVTAVLKNGKFIQGAKLEWPDKSVKITADKCEVGDLTLFKVIGQDIWFRIGELPAMASKSGENQPNQAQNENSSTPPGTLYASIGGPIPPGPTTSSATITKEKGMAITHQPQGGVYAGTNNLTNWYGGWVKYKADFNRDDSSIVPGLGFLGNITGGNTKHSTYSFSEGAIGPLAGAKVFGDDSEGNPWMVEADLALQYYFLKGDNDEGYFNKQHGWKLNARVEPRKQVGENTTLGFTAEGNIMLSKHLKSSWKGDSPSNRSSIEVGPYILYRINDNWEYEGALTFQKTWWDKQKWFKIIPIELVYKKTYRGGVGVSLPIGLSKTYKGIARAKDLITPFAFFQIDTGPWIRSYDKPIKQGRVVPNVVPNKEEAKLLKNKE